MKENSNERIKITIPFLGFMPKKSLASLELTAILNELQFLVRGKLSNIYQPEKKEFLFQIHTKEGNVLLKVVPGKLLCSTKIKEVPPTPSSFCMQLRKYIDNATINKIYQKEAERIVILELEKSQKYLMIVELFSKGNLILTDENYQIIAALEHQVWKERTVKVGVKYIFPTRGPDWKTLSEKELTGIFQQSKKNSLVISLATDLGLGGTYAEEVCRWSHLDKKNPPGKLEKKEIKILHQKLQEILKLLERPKGYLYSEEITPFLLSGQETQKIFPTYNEAIGIINLAEKKSPYEQKINSMQMMITQQEEAVRKQQRLIEVNQKKAELIYERYTPLKKLLEIVKELKKTKEWGEIEKELKKEKKIKKVDLKNKRILVDL